MITNESMTVSLYLYKLYRSKYLEENKDKELKQDDINENMNSKKLLYLFNTDLPKGDYMRVLEKFGTKVKVNGYNYNINKIAKILSKLGNETVYANNIVITNNEIDKENKIVSIFDTKTFKTYKLTINENNKILIMPRKFDSIGVNMLCVDEAEDIKVEDEYLISVLTESLNKNCGYITDIKKMYLFKDLVPKTFIRKWNEEDMLVSIVVDNYMDCDCEYYEDYMYGDDDEDDF